MVGGDFWQNNTRQDDPQEVQPISLGVPAASAKTVAGVCTQTPETPRTQTRPRLLVTRPGIGAKPGSEYRPRPRLHAPQGIELHPRQERQTIDVAPKE